MTSPDHGRQWRIVALAVVSASGRPLFLKNFPTKTAGSTAAAAFGDFAESSALSTPSASALDALAGDAKRYLSPWALKVTGESSEPPPPQQAPALPLDDLGGSSGKAGSLSLRDQQQQEDDDEAGASSSTKEASDSASLERSRQQPQSQLSLQQALSSALDFEEYTETETAQLFLYAALDRLDARRATEERRSGNPFESRGYAVFDRETRTKMRAFVLVRYWGRSLPSDCHHPCQTVLGQLIQKATVAYCDPFRDVALDEPLSESMVMDPFLTQILQASTELPPNSK